MHRHHPHLIGVLLAAALDRDVAAVDPGEKAGQAGRLDGFVGQRLVEQGVDAVLGFRAQARYQSAAAVVPDQDPLQKLVGAQEIRLAAQIPQHGADRRGGLGRRERPPERPGSAVG